MRIRKLVELDGEYGGWLEIDPAKLKRVATEFKTWLLTVDPGNDSFGFLQKDLPLVISALNADIGTSISAFESAQLGNSRRSIRLVFGNCSSLLQHHSRSFI
jgi:hypothetical protein